MRKNFDFTDLKKNSVISFILIELKIKKKYNPDINTKEAT
jgi:hypothetical protein